MRADWIRLMIAAARLPLRSDPANNQFDGLAPTKPDTNSPLMLLPSA